jgi:hypothetical protein
MVVGSVQSLNVAASYSKYAKRLHKNEEKPLWRLDLIL